jgi:outer membrane protein OmpA-like peptidoglycan-associated protein
MMRKIIQYLIVLLSILSFFSVNGCAVAVIGIGAAGAGAYAYFNGKLTKTYESEYHDTIQASGDTLEKLKVPVTETIADELKTEIKAKRFDDTPVAIEVVRIDPDHTQVSVRTGSVGVWDKRVSEQIHNYINEALSQKIADDEKSAEGLATEVVQPDIGEVVQPAIIEEDLAEDSAPAPVHVAASTDQKLPDPAFVIFFEQNSNKLSDTAIEKLNRISEILINTPAAELELNGYSDSIGAPSYNLMISDVRANAVKSYLVGKGIEPSRIMTLGHGAQKFIASNKSAERRRLNRRVEIELINP